MANHLGWFKFWTKALHDPKIVALGDGPFRVLVALWSLASENRVRGTVESDWKTVYAIAHVRDDSNAREQLLASGLVVEGVDLRIHISHWDEYQEGADKTNAERQKRYRNALRNGERNVTSNVTRSRSRSRREVERTEDHAEQGKTVGAGKPENGEPPEEWSHVAEALKTSTHMDHPKLYNWPWWDALAKAHPDPNLDPVREIAKMDAYLIRTGRWKKYKDWQRFVSTWFNNAEEAS